MIDQIFINRKIDYIKRDLVRLGELKVLPEKFAEDISKSAGFRNAIVHGYNDLDEWTIYRSVGDALKEYTQYCDSILKFFAKTTVKK